MNNLVGTEKQVAWAESIRDSKLNDAAVADYRIAAAVIKAEFLAQYTESDESIRVEVVRASMQGSANLEAALARLMDSRSAKFWISTRYISLSKMVSNEEDFPEA